MKPFININKTTASFTSSGRLNSYGLGEAIKAIPPAILPIAAANTLLRVCADACASSSYKLFKSINTMSNETYQSENTVRSHLKHAVSAGILTRREVFKSGRQMTNEYTFTKAFLVAATHFRKQADTTKRSAKENFLKLLGLFQKSLLALRNALFSAPKKAPKELIPRGSSNCPQLVVSSDLQKENNIHGGDIFEYRDEPVSEAVEFQTVRRERDTVRAHDIAQQRAQTQSENTELQSQINKAATRRAFGLMKSRPSDSASSGFNHDRFTRANREFEQSYSDMPSPEKAREIGQRKLAEIRKRLKLK